MSSQRFESEQFKLYVRADVLSVLNQVKEKYGEPSDFSMKSTVSGKVICSLVWKVPVQGYSEYGTRFYSDTGEYIVEWEDDSDQDVS